MTELTTYNKIPYPSEDQDPFFEPFEAMISELDQIIIQKRIQENAFLAGGGTITFNAGMNNLTWTADFIIPIFQYGKKVLINYGPDEATRTVTVLNGQALVVDIPYAMTADATVSLRALDTLTPDSYEQFVIGWRYGNTLYLRNLGNF